MELLPDNIKAILPPLYTNEDKDSKNIRVPLKIFDPAGRFTLYVTEWDKEDTFFGFCRSPLGPDCDELGYSSLEELCSTVNRFGMHMERDINWNPDTTLEQVMNGEKT